VHQSPVAARACSTLQLLVGRTMHHQQQQAARLACRAAACRHVLQRPETHSDPAAVTAYAWHQGHPSFAMIMGVLRKHAATREHAR
jgi:hypothetical protein